MQRWKEVSAALLLAGVLVAGCSPHQAPPATPVDSAATPTNRSFVNSTDVPNTPYYTQPGMNPGKVVQLKPIPSEAAFSQNTPLAGAVHDALLNGMSQDARYIAAASRGKSVQLVGSVSSASDKAKADEIAKSVKGVGTIIDKLTVSSAPKKPLPSP